jgi:hypothetical protein
MSKLVNALPPSAGQATEMKPTFVRFLFVRTEQLDCAP